MTNFNERTNTLRYKSISLTLYFRKGWCWSCVRGELETETDCYILIPSSSDHSSTYFAFWLGCSTVSHWGPSVWNWFSLRWHPISNWNWLPSLSWLYFCLTSTCFLWAYASAIITEFNHVHRSRWYSDIFDRVYLFRCSSAYLHRCISWLMARSRVNMLHTDVPLERGKIPTPTSLLDMTLNNLMVRFQWCRSFGECGALFRCHCSQVHSGPE